MRLICVEEAVVLFVILFGNTFCCGEVNTIQKPYFTSGIKTTLNGILFECPTNLKQKLNGEINCEPYIAISIKTDPSLHINKLHQFLTLDQVYVANRFSTAKLVAPYVIEISRGEPITMYPLEYDKSVTAEELENGFATDNHFENDNFLFNDNNEFIFNSMMHKAKENDNNGKRRHFNAKLNDGYTGGIRNIKSAIKQNNYFVFNAKSPIPFLMTTVKVYQKRYSTWWKFAPAVTVNSYSGCLANENLSVCFKCHINIFQLPKSRNILKNFKLLIPTDNKSAKVNDPLTFYNFQSSLAESYFSSNYLNPDIKVKTLLESCPYNRSILCINMLDEMVPGYSLKIHLPFFENAFIKPNVFKVKIHNVITDATIKDAVKISTSLVNEGFEVSEFSVNVDCSEHIESNKTYVTKRLLPHVGETIKFCLPFIFKENKKVYCKIQVKAVTTISKRRNAKPDLEILMPQKIVTTRKIAIIPHQRCLCVWKCNCHCLDKLETNVDYNICQELDSSSQSKAGLLINSNYYELHEKDSEEESTKVQALVFNCFWFSALLFLLMLSLGCCKAILGVCIQFIDKLGYDYLQPGRKYDDVSKLRHFLINLFYFILLPFLICCNCFAPSAEDLLISNSENYMIKIYIYVYEVFYDRYPAIIIIEEATTSQQTDDY